MIYKLDGKFKILLFGFCYGCFLFKCICLFIIVINRKLKCLYFVVEYGNVIIEIFFKLKNNMFFIICMINILFYFLIFKMDYFKVLKCIIVYYVCGLL